ncbi:anillin, actin binding protein 2 isoform X2 [Amia ocellicauda]|uniref:anillin, actin binding protein 2 isoform X2 n=1 Tax=Amia ocellicauda TaxID=2972642 RepID=UPI0034645CC8
MDPFVEKVTERTHARQLTLEEHRAELMEGQEAGLTRNPLKRLRDPLSDSDENVPSVSAEPQECLRRRCHDVSDDENLNPVESPLKRCRRQVETEIKPDTPAISSITSRIGVLAGQGPHWDTEDNSVESPSSVFLRDGPVAQQRKRGLSTIPSVSVFEDDSSTGNGQLDQSRDQAVLETSTRGLFHSFCVKGGGDSLNTSASERSQSSEFSLIGESEFRSRVEKFEVKTLVGDPLVPTSRPRSLSSMARAIQEKLLNSEVPSASKANRLRKEREEELRLVRSQSKGDNIWLKKNGENTPLSEDSGVIQGMPQKIKRSRRTQWPPLYQLDSEEPQTCQDETISSEVSLQLQDDSVAESPTEMTSCAGEKQPKHDDSTVNGPHEEEATQSQKKVTFVLEPEMIGDRSYSEADLQESERKESGTVSELELSSQEEMNSSEIIDQIFDGVLDTSEEEEEDQGSKGTDNCPSSGVETAEEGQLGEPQEDEEKAGRSCDQRQVSAEEEAGSGKHEDSDDELLLPPGSILSPLTKSVEAVTPLRLVSSDLAGSSPFLMIPLELRAESSENAAPMYSIDAYRNQRQTAVNAIQSLTPTTRKMTTEQPSTKQPLNVKEKIRMLNEEIGKLQTIMQQTSQALNCCTDEEHGKGSLEEAEAEKLLLVSMEKRLSLLSEMSHLKELGANAQSVQLSSDPAVQEPCRGTVCISDVRLPLKVEFVCSARAKTGRPSHYFFVLIRYGSNNIVATPLATAEDAQNGDTIAFPTSVTLQDIRSSFEIDVEVYSLSQTGSTHHTERRSTKSKVTPRKLLSTKSKSHPSQSSTLSAMGVSIRNSNFSLVGSHKITLTSLGQNKFPLDKMKFDGKVRKLLGDEFQEKVPFLSPLEGNIYLRLEYQSHSCIEHKGFLTMFEDISGFGAWHRRWFSLQGSSLSYWNYPNDERSKAAVECINLANCTSSCVKPVQRDSCARPNTFELVGARTLCKDDREILAKCWFSADTKEEREEWIEKLNQSLLDHRTWNPAVSGTSTQPDAAFSSVHCRESML